MSFTEKTIKTLSGKLNPANVKKHPFSGMSYIEGWHAIQEANTIFAFEWSRETLYNREVCRYEKEIKNKGTGWKVGYEAKVCITIDGITREGTGHGSGIAMDLFDCIEGAAKEAETDAMKRALMTFGNKFGLALYDKTQKDVGVDPVPYEPTEEEKRTINDICHLIKCCQSQVDLDSVLEEYQSDISAFGDNVCHEDINATCTEVQAVWKAGNKVQNIVYKFNNVKHALDSFVEMCTFINGCDNPVLLEAYRDKWSWRIDALRSWLSAKTHEKDGFQPHERLVNLYTSKAKELS